MGKRAQVSSEVRKLIIQAVARGDTLSEVATTFNVARNTAHYIVRRHRDTGSTTPKPRSGRLRKMTVLAERRAVRAVKVNPRMTAVDLVRDHQLPITPSAAAKMLQKHGLNGRRPAKKPLVSRKNRLARLTFARRHRNWDQMQWARVLWSDESKFNLMSSDGISWVRRPVGKRYDGHYQVPTVKHGGGNVMVWAAALINAVKTWWNELERVGFNKKLNFTQVAAVGDKSVSHWSQMAWATTARLGCGVKYCTNGGMTMAVCQYSPRGNYLNRLVYLPGKPCLKCQSGTTCASSLCQKP